VKWLTKKKPSGICQYCGGKIVYYPDKNGVIRISCENRCKEWKMRREINRRKIMEGER